VIAVNRFFRYLLTAWSIFLISQSMAYEFSIPIESQNNDNLGVPPSSGGNAGERISSNMEDPIIITKSVFPSKEGDYLSGEKATIVVEIKNNKKNRLKHNITSLGIWEIPDDDLGILPDSAKWAYSNSILELSNIKMDILRGDPDEHEYLSKYSSCFNNTRWYLLGELNETKCMNSSQKDKIVDYLYNYYDIDWLDKNDLIFNETANIFSIKNEEDETAEIAINESGDTNLKISDGREYRLRSIAKNKSNYIYDVNNVINFLATDIDPKGSILFWYEIKPKKVGNFSTETIIKLYDSDYSNYPDISNLVPVVVMESNPVFEVHPMPNKAKVYSINDLFGKRDVLDVIYDITYLGGASQSVSNNIAIEFDKSKEGYFYFVDEHRNRNDSLANKTSLKDYSRFNKYETQEILMHIAYPFPGIFKLPGVWINGIHYGFPDEKIEVDTWFQRNKDKIGWILGLLGFLIGSLYKEKICAYLNDNDCIIPKWIQITSIAVVVFFALYLL
jgi:hypothetical protein